MRCNSEAEFAILDKFKKREECREIIPKESKDKKRNINVKPIILLVAYMFDFLSELSDKEKEELGINEDIDTILRAIPSYIDIMLSQTMMLSQMYKMNQSPKKITAKNIMTII